MTEEKVSLPKPIMLSKEDAVALPKTSIMTNKRMSDIKVLLETKIADEDCVNELIKKISDIMKFSGEPKKYTDYCKRYYEENKVELNKKRAEARRIKLQKNKITT